MIKEWKIVFHALLMPEPWTERNSHRQEGGRRNVSERERKREMVRKAGIQTNNENSEIKM